VFRLSPGLVITLSFQSSFGLDFRNIRRVMAWLRAAMQRDLPITTDVDCLAQNALRFLRRMEGDDCGLAAHGRVPRHFSRLRQRIVELFPSGKSALQRPHSLDSQLL
jgi:hypothetical protein